MGCLEHFRTLRGNKFSSLEEPGISRHEKNHKLCQPGLQIYRYLDINCKLTIHSQYVNKGRKKLSYMRQRH